MINLFDLEKMKTLKVIEMEKKQLEEERQKLEEEKVRSDIWKLFGIFVYKSSDPYLEMIFKLFEKDEKNIFGNCHNDIIGNKRVWGHGVALSCDKCDTTHCLSAKLHNGLILKHDSGRMFGFLFVDHDLVFQKTSLFCLVSKLFRERGESPSLDQHWFRSTVMTLGR